MEFTETQINRYSRHILLPEVGGKGQKKIIQGKILIVGAGGLGSPAALYLAAAGIGTIGLIDSDVVDLSNLQRQVIHQTPDVGRPKVVSGKEKIQALNPDVNVVMYEERLTASNALKILSGYDVVIDGVDNFPTKFLINDACYFAGKPLVHGGILRFDGRVTTIIPKQSACYRCVFKKPPPEGLVASCQEAGVIGVLAGIIGTIQATEALKLILGIGRPLTDRLLDFDARRTQFREIRIKRNPDCPLCGERPTITELREDGNVGGPTCALPGQRNL
ncbi:MAG: molybdopterin-synthase adenylyltransferase MoeB [Nitrospira sp.]|nr:molybdopterin-synthase adenylyltransferase MoeB [Nitrospira sp.]MBS0172655.1 molybdopterin-synthase adenylyltransferase MoeB [Nitrospira sp.]MBS0179963.1 molybdopterin-synthase adenylyltransferase MoeB [Nitrospira sp.]MBX3338766.1 molybdopterin-synthase adenylyltransferase MoeB [Nitrospira sp.]MCW5781078.1 molybdopterin-synthase adenylyltransferase MoeB [Nitrospira sp.]